MELPPDLVTLAQDQHGVLSRKQFEQAGVPAGLVRWHSTRDWRSVLPGVLLLHTGQPSDRQRLVAAQLYAGPRSWLRGDSALACLGAGGRLTSPVKLYVPHPQRSRRVMWVSIAATRLGNERLVEKDGLRLSCRARAVTDAAAEAVDDRTARAIVVGAVQEGFVRVVDVQHWVGVRRRNGTRRLKQALAEAAAGAWSVPEADLAALLRRAPGVAGWWANPALQDAAGRHLTTPDLWLDEVGLAVMVHSRQFHSSVLDWDATVLADQDLRDAGVEVVPLTPRLIGAEPAAALDAVLAGLGRARRRPRPTVVATPREHFSWAA